MKEKRIEFCELLPKDIRLDFGNPRKINKQKLEELKRSLKDHDNFGIIVINEKNQCIAGSQRVTVEREIHPTKPMKCNKLIGYSIREQKAINIKSNEHAGVWDFDVLKDWLKEDLDYNIEFSVELKEEISNVLTESKVKDMDLFFFEKYDYLIIVFKDERDKLFFEQKLKMDDKYFLIGEKKK